MCHPLAVPRFLPMPPASLTGLQPFHNSDPHMCTCCRAVDVGQLSGNCVHAHVRAAPLFELSFQ